MTGLPIVGTGHAASCLVCLGERDRYTKGECWLLAYVLNQYGFPVYTLGSDVDAWWHVVVKLGHDQYLDINGLSTEDELLAGWPDNMSEEPMPYQGQLFLVTWPVDGNDDLVTDRFADFATYCEAVQQRYTGPNLAGDLLHAEQVARHLVQIYFWSPPCLNISSAGIIRRGVPIVGTHG